MATTTTVNSSYAGTVAGEIIGKAFKEADTIQKGLVTILPNIPVKQVIRKIDYGNGRQDYSCGFAPAGSVTLDEVILEPKKIKNEAELCKEDFRNVWDTASMGFSAHNDNMPVDEEQALLVEILADTAQATDSDIWVGEATDDGHFDGFIPLFLGDATVIDVASPATITATNVVAEMQKASNAVPVALRRKADLVFAISADVAQAYNNALITAGINNGLGGQGQELYLGMYKLEIINGLPANTMVIYQKKNLYFGTGLLSDHNEVRIKDMDETDLSGTVRYKMVYTAGVQYVRGSEVVLYTTYTV
ncbi:MAG: hypothetical protein ACOVOV_09425 [Dolichospermum sp.]|jgi:hypothetical protein